MSGLALTPENLGARGRLVLQGGLAFGLLLVLYLTWSAPDLVVFLPIVLLGGVGAWYLFRHPLLNLCVVLGGFAIVADFEEGLQLSEVLYGLYLITFLAHWFVTRGYLYRERIFVDRVDRALALFLCWMTGSLFLTLLFQHALGIAFREWSTFILLALYFPVKEACIRYRRGPQAILGVLLFLGVFVALRNLLNFQEIVVSATYAWQIARGRVTTNEVLLLLPALAALVLLLHTNRRLGRAILLGAFLLFFASLILTQSRAYWLDFALGTILLFFLVRRAERLRLISLSLAGLAGTIVVGLLLFGDLIWLMAYGLADRLLSLLTATQEDISLINRFYESRAAWHLILQNPVLGYGLGARYRVFDLISDTTFFKPFIHNSFLLIWFKFGLVGLVALLYTWGGCLWMGLRASIRTALTSRDRIYALIATVGLGSLLPSTYTSLQFYMSDTALAFALLAGWAAGLYHRSTALHAPEPSR
ncbi:MAG: hypothetical protein D6746_16925 [Bacteroidetes bacterium]|nr:MAG: hypothetical protein D6746_16925 [Bacteroidota bacterium]